MIFGIESHEILMFFRQAGLAIAGAASFWGLMLLIDNRKRHHWKENKDASAQLMLLFFGAGLVYFSAWALLAMNLCAFCADAHEGLSKAETIDGVRLALQNQFSFMLSLGLVWAFGLGALVFARKMILDNLKWLFGISFVIITFIMLFPWAGSSSFRDAIAGGLHSWHSIFTVGTVVTVDFLYLSFRFRGLNFLDPLFSKMNKFIWMGLGIDFISAGFVFHEVFDATEKFFFMQTVVAIVIINGVILSGPIARKVLRVREKTLEKRGWGLNLYTISAICGSISLASWFTITLVDGFRSLTLSYAELFLFYGLSIALVFAGHEIMERYIIRAPKAVYGQNK